jgi:diguanylate cyclase
MMKFPFFSSLDVKEDPNALLRLFVVSSLVSIFMVLLLSGFGFWEVLQRYVTNEAEEDAIKVSRALLGEERGKLVVPGPGAGSRIEIRPADFPQLDRDLRRFLGPFNIIKIKIYSPDARIVYSTDTRIIGEFNKYNVRLSRALAGEFDSQLERKEQVHDLADEVKFNVDVVETYIPIRDHGKVIGCFEIYMDVTKYRDATHNALVVFLGLLASVLLLGFGLSYPFIRKGTREVKQVQEVLRKQTITDPLTGIPNKRQIVLTAQREFSRSTRRREKGLPDAYVGLIMLDADRFKEVNDTYGHLAGDVLLKELAERIANSLRAYDSVGRFGGEEFLVVLSGAGLEQSYRVAEKIWMLVREEPFLLEGEPVSITASLGVAASQPDDTEYTEVLKRADAALYRAKSGGRDQVVV